LVKALVPQPAGGLSPQDQRSLNVSEANRRAEEQRKIAEEKRATARKIEEENRATAQKLAEEKRAAAQKLEDEKRSAATKPPVEFSAKARSLKDFEGYLTEYKNELDKDLMVFPPEIPILPSQGLAIPLPVGSDTARMNSKYTALLMGIKSAYELGALTGPDMGIVESQVTNPATIAGALTSRNAMKEQVKVLEGILKRGRENLESSYGRKMDVGMPPDGAGAVNPANDPLGLRPRRP
jgi:hypothetical protein